MSVTRKLVVMRKIIDALKEKCHKKEDLKVLAKKAFPKLSPEALRKRISRYQTELEKLGLVEKRGDKYCWYIYINDFKNREDVNIKLQHSRKLIPAMKSIAGITWPRYVMTPSEEYVSADDRMILERCVEDHLRVYSEIWKLLEDYKNMMKKGKKKRELFCTNLMEELREEFKKESIVEPNKESRYRSFVGNNLPLLICSHILFGSPSRLNLEGEKICFGDSLVAKGKHLFSRVEEFVKCKTEDEFNVKAAKQIGLIERDAAKIRLELEQEIRKLILRIESSEPLLGGCEICPKVYIEL